MSTEFAIAMLALLGGLCIGMLIGAWVAERIILGEQIDQRRRSDD